ncbi:MAG: glycoside hydrolase family 3 C-terminal domain-containing protein [Candidatus Izimaplasma sp.]|nr:glycoside hydrolase family 3 C-terminal domain-containing protein [Candidatus Izimaplasma bacterium]
MKYKEILNSMTLIEKINWSSGNSMWDFLGNKRLNIKNIKVADGPHGVRVYQKDINGNQLFDYSTLEKTTMFPNEAAMAATFNPDLIYQVGEIIGEECNMFGVDILLAPGVNQKRSPLGGRNFEYYSEDPFLSGKMAVSFINGIQSTGVGACIKHFALNEQETQRRFVNTIIDKRTLHEFYLLPFEMAVKEANPFMIMTSYNRINGSYAGENEYLLRNVLRNKWNYDGVVISDWGGVQNKIKSIKSGMNIEMPGPSEFNNQLIEAVYNKEVTEKELDNSLIPLLKLYDKVQKNKNKGKKINLSKHHLFAQKVAEEAIVLLKNNGILPLLKTKKIGIIGNFAKKPRVNGGGSATLKPHTLENSFDELSKYFKIDFAQGYIEGNTNKDLLKEVERVAKNNEIVIYFTGTTVEVETEGKERTHMKLPSGHIEVFQQISKSNKNIIVILNNGSALDLTDIIDYSSAIIEAHLLGSANSVALKKILTGEINPSGRLSETWPLNIENTANYRNYPSLTDDVSYCGDILKNGYRFFDTHNFPVRFPFGYGLSYTEFEYKEMKLSKNKITDNEILVVTVSIENIGKYDGFETVQVYIHENKPYYPRPRKELKGFKKVFIKQGEIKDIEITLNSRSFAIYAIDFDEFRVEPGKYTIMVGSNVSNIHLEKTIDYQTSASLRSHLTLEHPYKNWLKYKYDSVSYLESTYREIAWHEKEEPISRLFKRLKREYNINNQEYNKMLNRLK